MDKLNLSLRQRKLLHMMQEQTTYTPEMNLQSN